MTAHNYNNTTPLPLLIQSLGLKIDTAFINGPVQSTLAVIFFTMAILPVVQPVLAQQKVHIGSANMTPEVVVNLNTIDGYSAADSKQNLQPKQLNFPPHYGNRRLLIPNLQTAKKSLAPTLRLPSMGGMAPIVMPSLLPIKRRDSLSTAPSLPQAPAKDRLDVAEPESREKKPINKARSEFVRLKSKQMSAANESKSVSVSTKRRLVPPPPPPPRIIDKSKLRKSKVPTDNKALAKKLENVSTKSTKKSKSRREQLAVLPSANERMLEIRFRSGSSVLTRNDENLLRKMTQNIGSTAVRLQLKAFAKATGNNSSKARRLSLSRALVVRSFLIENGLRSTRIDVRALGIARDGGAPDRVDILLLKR